MDPLSVAGSIAGLVTLADAVFRGVYKYYKTVSDASKEIQNLASQLQSFAGILHSLVLLAGALEQHGTHTTLQMTHISDATTLLGEIQGRLNKSMSKNNSTKLSNIQRSLKWPFTKTHTKELSNALAQQQQIISLALEADSLSSLIELLGNSEDMKKKISSIQVGVENLQVLTRVEINAERKRILDSFLKVNPQPNLDTSRKLRHPGTGTWLTESLQFQQWIETAGSKMWLTGIPGAGKTVLAGAVIQKALDKGKNSPQVGVAFFFCDYKDEKATVSSNILGAIVSQLGRQSNQAFDEVKKLYESLHPPNGLTRDLDSDFLQDCLEKIFKHFEQIILVVDGLDECGDNTDETIEWLVNVADYSTNVTMALASRDEYKIDLKLRDSFTKIPVSARREDIILYVASEIDRRVRDGRLRINDMSIKDDILTKLSHDADGMFRWVTCQLDYICGCPTDADRRVALKELPPTLDATYDRMLRRIHRGHPRARHIVQKCLQLLAIKGFRWHIRALCCAISVPDTINVTLDEGSIVTEVEVLIQCSSFIRKSEDAKYFEFSHFTVREFLERDRLLKDHELASYHLSVPISHAALCQQSLRYLLLRNFYHMSELDKSGLGQYLRKIQEDPFYVSATIDWIFALRYTPQEPCCLELAKCLFNPHKSPSFISWAIQICARLLELAPDSSVQASSSHLLRAASMVLDPEFRPIHLAAALDMPEICEYLIDVDTKWNTVSMIGSPLECSIGGPFCLIGSCPEGLKDLDEISDVVALAYATHRPGQVTSMLKEAGCVMQDSPCQLGQWSLMEVAILSAVASLDFSPVTNLVSMRWVISETEAVAFEKNMALLLRGYPYSYVPGNHTQLIASFLQLITTLNSFRAYDSEGGFKMCVAAWNTAVKLECDFIEDVHLIDTRISLSLDALIHKCGVAISNDDVELMQRYLGDIRITGPEISDDGADGCGYSLLRRAITKNSVKVVRLLSERGYSLKSPFWDGLLPIHEAWSCGEDMIRLLFEFGASQFEVDSRGNNIWHLAASRFKYNTLSALRKSTAEERLRALHMQNKEGFTPLTLAIYEMGSLSEDGSDGREDAAATLQFLLDACGCDTLCWQCAMSPWHLVARSGSVIAIKQLKKSGVTPDTIQEGQCTPLHALNSMASKECVELLRAAFPTADSIQHQNRTPLQHFIYNCFIQRIDPPLGVIESLADTTTSTTQTHCALWDYFCKGILGSTTLSVEYPHTSLDTIFQDILGIRAIEAYEEVKCESAIIPLFSSMVSNKLTPWLDNCCLENILSRTGLWSSACVAPETIKQVKDFIVVVAMSNVSPLQRSAVKGIHILLNKGVGIDLREGFSSILEEACRRLECGERDTAAFDPTASIYGVQREVFTDIVSRASMEQLNAPQPKTGGYLLGLAEKGYHHGSSWMIENLVSKGLDPNKHRFSREGNSLLAQLLLSGATPAALSLIELGADPLLRDYNDAFNALHAAAFRGQLEFLKSLWRKFKSDSMEFPWQETAGIIMNVRPSQQLSLTSLNALHLAACGGNLPTLQFLINELLSDAKSTTVEGYNCLHFAAISGSTEIIHYLCSLGLNINEPTNDGDLPIHFAVRLNKESAVQTLMELGSLTHADSLGMTPRMHAESLKYPNIIKLLGKCQSDTQTHMDHTKCVRNRGLKRLLEALELAINEGNLDACRNLHSQGAPLHMSMPSCSGCSPLITAIFSGRTNIIQWLLEKRASILHQACHIHGGESIMDIVVRRRQLTPYLWRIFDICIDTAWDLDSLGSPIFSATQSNNHDSLSLILKHIRHNLEQYSILTRYPKKSVLARMVSRRHRRRTPIHEASARGDLRAVNILIEAGADVDALDTLNRTAIQVTDKSQIIARLIAAGSKCGWLDDKSWKWVMGVPHLVTKSCLDIFKERIGNHRMEGSRNLSGISTRRVTALHPKPLSLLLQCGVDPNWVDHGGRTFIHLSLMEFRSTTYLLSLCQIIDCKPFPWNSNPGHPQYLAWLNDHWRLFKRRMPFPDLQRMMNLHPDQGISPLCRAAAVDALLVIDRCLEMGARIDFEGSSYGSALMAACANCRLRAVKHLVKRGASIVYHGECGLTSAIQMANGHEKIIRWLLVGQFIEQPKLEYCTFQDLNNSPPLRCWSGIQEESMRLTGHYERRPNESLLSYISRLSTIRRDMRGRALPLHQGDPLTGLFNIVRYQV